MLKTNNPICRQSNLVVQEMEAELLIYDLGLNKAFCLNQTSAFVYQLCNGKRNVAEISRILSQKLNATVPEDLVWLALDQFKRDNLLENNDQLEIDFNGLSRRQVIKKVGLASLIMLPMVSSIVAPAAAMAASGSTLLANCVGCSSPSQCASNNCISGTCSAAGAVLSFPPGTHVAGSCPGSSTFCSQCALFCCSGKTNLSGGSCFCIA